MNKFVNETKIASFLKWAKERKHFLIGFGAVLGVVFAVMLTQMRVLEITSRSVPYKSCIQFYHIKPKVGDLCVVEYKTQDGKTQTLVKYLAGTAGETLTMWKGDIFVNHKRYVGKPNNRRLMPICLEGEEVTIPEGYVFVAGTHEDSLDSRYKEFGFVKVSDIKGKAMPLGERIGRPFNVRNYKEPSIDAEIWRDAFANGGKISQKTQNKFQQMIENIQNGEEELEEDLYIKAQENERLEQMKRQEQIKQEEEEFIQKLSQTLSSEDLDEYKNARADKEKQMRKTEVLNYDWAKWRNEWLKRQTNKHEEEEFKRTLSPDELRDYGHDKSWEEGFLWDDEKKLNFDWSTWRKEWLEKKRREKELWGNRARTSVTEQQKDKSAEQIIPDTTEKQDGKKKNPQDTFEKKRSEFRENFDKKWKEFDERFQKNWNS